MITIHRGAAHRLAKQRSADGTKRRQYVSTSIAGLQITVSDGTQTQSVYADLSGTSPLCTTSGNISTSSVIVPTFGTQETFQAFETDQTPTGEGASGYAPGYGSGFPNTTNILAAINQSETLSGSPGGQYSVGLTLGPVAAFFYDCTGASEPPSPIPQSYTANFGDDRTGFDNGPSGPFGGRIVVTSGVASTGTILLNFCDPDGGYVDSSTTAAPFVDVDASPVPITVTASDPAITLAAIVNNGTPPPGTAYASTASIPNDGYYWDDIFLVVGVNVAATYSSSSSATVTFKNNLTATNPYTGVTVNSAGAPYLGSMPYYVAAIAASTYSISLAPGGSSSGFYGIDEGAGNGMGAESAFGAADGACTGTATDITITPGSINTSTWEQPFTVNASASATAGTCTFYLYDEKAGTVTQPITVTVS